MSNDTVNPTGIDPKTLARAKQQAKILISSILAQYTNTLAGQAPAGKELRTYGDIVRLYGIDLPGFDTPAALEQPIHGRFFLAPILDKYVEQTEQRLLKAQVEDPGGKTRLRITPQNECYAFTNNKDHRLYPEQDPVFRQLYHDIWVDKTKAWRTVWNNGKTGSGKTEIINAIVDKFIADGRHINPALGMPMPGAITWFTVTNAVEQTKQKARRAGLGPYIDSGVLWIGPYTALFSSEGENVLFTLETTIDAFTGEEQVNANWCPGRIPLLVVFDEAQKLKKPETLTAKRVRLLDEFLRSLPPGFANTKFLFFTATLAEKINDTQMFVCMSDVKFEGQLVTHSNFNIQFASIIANGRPDLPNMAAMERFRKFMGHRLYEIPKIRWPYQARIDIKFFRFLSDFHRLQYDQATAEYLEQCKKLGKDTPNDRALRAIALLKHRKKVEPIRSEQVADCMYADVQRGESAIMGTAFTGAIIRSIFHLFSKYGISRDEISVIWGGRENIKPERILTQQEIMEIAAQALETGEAIDRKTYRLITLNLAWAEDRMMFGDETEQAQNERYKQLKDLRLIGVQTIQQRQLEIDKFMDGRAKYCFFTTASGGTGLSLEHADSRTSPRNLYSSPIYSGMEITQVFGRPHRRNSISNTNIFMCLMAGTVEQAHVAPLMYKKLQAIGASSSAKDDISAALAALDPEEFSKIDPAEQNFERVETDDLDDEVDDDDND